MDLSPQKNGKTQPFVDNSGTSNLHDDNRNVQTPGEFIVVKQVETLLKMMGDVRKSIRNLKC